MFLKWFVSASDVPGAFGGYQGHLVDLKDTKRINPASTEIISAHSGPYHDLSKYPRLTHLTEPVIFGSRFMPRFHFEPCGHLH